MNFLAHFLLAAPVPAEAPGLIVGAFAADVVKSPAAVAALPADVREGIAHHRRVDAFTDCHPRVSLSKQRLGPTWRRYAGIIVDVTYDYCLASRWDQYAAVPLADYARQTYRVLMDAGVCLPDDARRRIDWMIAGDWLTSYATLDGIGVALSRISERLRQRFGRELSLQNALVEARRQEGPIHADFAEFFPQLLLHSR